MSEKILRRDFLLGLGAATLLASNQSSGAMNGTIPKNVPDLNLPLNNLINLMRMQSNIGEIDQTPWHYNGTLYAQKG